jgi:hypothetical protein
MPSEDVFYQDRSVVCVRRVSSGGCFQELLAVKYWDTETAEKREEITEKTRVFVLSSSSSLRALRVGKPQPQADV